MTMDISDTLAPNSDQLDAIDLVQGPRTFTVAGVKKGNAEQPVEVALEEFPRVWRPGKSMRRVLAAAWGAQASEWVGRRVTLYCDPDVMFGREKVGGTRISHLSHIDGPKRVPLLISKGRSAVFTVQPLKEAAPPPPVDYLPLVKAATTADECRGIWKQAKAAGALTEELHEAIGARAAELEKVTDEGGAA